MSKYSGRERLRACCQPKQENIFQFKVENDLNHGLKPNKQIYSDEYSLVPTVVGELYTQ